VDFDKKLLAAHLGGVIGPAQPSSTEAAIVMDISLIGSDRSVCPDVFLPKQSFACNQSHFDSESGL
jgi:hypothetical protein